MSRNLHSRLERIEQVLGQFELSPDKVREAMRRWQEHRELPEHPKLRALIEQINADLREMTRLTCGDAADEDALR